MSGEGLGGCKLQTGLVLDAVDADGGLGALVGHALLGGDGRDIAGAAQEIGLQLPHELHAAARWNGTLRVGRGLVGLSCLHGTESQIGFAMRDIKAQLAGTLDVDGILLWRVVVPDDFVEDLLTVGFHRDDAVALVRCAAGATGSHHEADLVVAAVEVEDDVAGRVAADEASAAGAQRETALILEFGNLHDAVALRGVGFVVALLGGLMDIGEIGLRLRGPCQQQTERHEAHSHVSLQ